MKSVAELWIACLKEAGVQCGVCTKRDELYARRRFEKEGLSFLTIVLPSLEKLLLNAVSQDASSVSWPGFSARRGLPQFLGGFLRKFFESEVGSVSDRAAILRSLRQILLFCAKLELECSSDRVGLAFLTYAETDRDLDTVVAPDWFKPDRLIVDYFARIERSIQSDGLPVRHSSGALATREKYNARFARPVWTERLQAVIPYWDVWYVPHVEEEHAAVEITPVADEKPVRVVSVPKTMKGPRIIACEPLAMQYAQQGVLSAMTTEMENNIQLRTTVGWLDQEPNRSMARDGSVHGSYATLDLSEASDRVANSLVLELLSKNPYLSKLVQACRSTRASLPNGDIIELNKFASMGSALCFPFETLVFRLVLREGFRRAGRLSDFYEPGSHRIFGDDLIVPKEVAHHVMQALVEVGLKVNYDKSFWSGLFRESCGGDYYGGVDVGVIKLRHPLPASQRQPTLFRSAVELHNLLFQGDYPALASSIKHLLCRDVQKLYAARGSSVTAFWTDDYSLTRNRMKNSIHQTRAYSFKESKPLDPLQGYGAFRKFLQPAIERDEDHLERDGRSRCLSMHTAWVTTA